METVIAVITVIVGLVMWLVSRRSDKRSQISSYQSSSAPASWSAKSRSITFPPTTDRVEFEGLAGELEQLIATTSADAPVRLSLSADPMDDHPILTLTIAAVNAEGSKQGTLPVLVLRATKMNVQMRLDAYVHLSDRFFFRKGKEIGMRVRFDETDAVTIKTSLSTDLSSIFVETAEQIVCGAARCGKLKVQIIPERGEAVLTTFDFEIVRPAVDLFLRAVFGPEAKMICRINPEIVHWCNILGPKNTYLKKMALKDRGMDPGPMDYVKRLAFFQAAEQFARAKRSSEITGNVVDGNWTYHLYQDAAEDIRAAMGPLTINL